MKKLFLVVAIFTPSVFSAPPVTHQFTNGTTIEASQVNSNYQELADRIEALQNQVVQLQNTQPKELVGFTATTFPQSQSKSYFILNAACESEFTGSKICNTIEIANSSIIPALDASSSAWVKPSYKGITGTTSPLLAEEIVGVAYNTADCIQVDANGTFSVSCDNPLNKSVACCR